jgi:hypothetical protein
MTPPATAPSTFAELVSFFIGIINMLIPLLLGLTFLFIVWKIIDAWIIHADDETKRSEGKMIAFIGVIVMFVMIAIWGILAFFQTTLVGN